MVSRLTFACLWYIGLLSVIGQSLYSHIQTGHNTYGRSSLLESWIQQHPPSYTSILMLCGLYLFAEVSQRLCKPKESLPNDNTTIHKEKSTRNSHVIIAAHKSGDSLGKSLPTILRSFPMANIWVAENGNDERDDGDTRNVCIEYGVQYRYYPIANKTNALLKTAIEIRDRHPSCEYVVLLDDDTEFVDTFYIRRDLFEDRMTMGYCCGITINKSEKYNLWEHLIDYEYRTISYRNELKSVRSTIMFCHGIVCVYDIDKMIEIYSKNACLPHGLPFGEDSWAGLDARMAGYKLKQDNQNIVRTYCPKQLFSWCSGIHRVQGFGASSIFKQRALRWYLSWPRRIPGEIALLLTYDTGSWFGNISYRFDIAWYFLITILSCSWLFYLLKISFTTQAWELYGILHGGLFGTTLLCSIIRYSGFPVSLREGVRWSTIVLAPIMNIITCFLMGTSFVISILYYIPLVRSDYKKLYMNTQRHKLYIEVPA